MISWSSVSSTGARSTVRHPIVASHAHGLRSSWLNGTSNNNTHAVMELDEEDAEADSEAKAKYSSEALTQKRSDEKASYDLAQDGADEESDDDSVDSFFGGGGWFSSFKYQPLCFPHWIARCAACCVALRVALRVACSRLRCTYAVLNRCVAGRRSRRPRELSSTSGWASCRKGRSCGVPAQRPSRMSSQCSSSRRTTRWPLYTNMSVYM